MFKKIIATVLASLMLAGGGITLATQLPTAIVSAATTGVTEDGFEYEVDDDTGKESNLIIPSQIQGKKVIRIGNYAFVGCKSITDVTLSRGITSIGSNAFEMCRIKSITIPDTIDCIENCAFRNCENLTNVFIPESVSILGEQVFAGCMRLVEFSVDPSNNSLAHFQEFYTIKIKPN